MTNYLHNSLLIKLPAAGRLLLVPVFLFMLPLVGNAQKKQLTPATQVQKIAFIDHSRLRREFNPLREAREKLVQEGTANKKLFDQSMNRLNQQTQKQMHLDSLQGGRKREQLINETAVRRSALIKNYQEAEKKRNLLGMEALQQYERKIIAAIDGVVAEGGFTDVKPVIKDSTSAGGVDITNAVLKKLN